MGGAGGSTLSLRIARIRASWLAVRAGDVSRRQAPLLSSYSGLLLLRLLARGGGGGDLERERAVLSELSILGI